MIEVRTTEEFDTWLGGLKDARAKQAVIGRLSRFELGLLGDAKPVGEGVSEGRIHYGPGFRVYFVQRGDVLIVVLCGGDKQTQGKDIEKAKALARGL